MTSVLFDALTEVHRAVGKTKRRAGPAELSPDRGRVRASVSRLVCSRVPPLFAGRLDRPLLGLREVLELNAAVDNRERFEVTVGAAVATHMVPGDIGLVHRGG